MTSPSEPNRPEDHILRWNEKLGRAEAVPLDDTHINVRFCAECPAWVDLTDAEEFKTGLCCLLPEYHETDGAHYCYSGQQFLRRKEAREPLTTEAQTDPHRGQPSKL